MKGCSWKSSSPNSRQMIAFPTTATGDNIAIAVAFEKITTERKLSLSFQKPNYIELYNAVFAA